MGFSTVSLEESTLQQKRERSVSRPLEVLRVKAVSVEWEEKIKKMGLTLITPSGSILYKCIAIRTLPTSKIKSLNSFAIVFAKEKGCLPIGKLLVTLRLEVQELPLIML
jgi:hypothetical protein